MGQYNPLRYRGYVYDVETGLYYLQSRYYDPEWGRFINADSYVATGQGFVGNNMFAYCLNNPINLVDYSGCFAQFFSPYLQPCTDSPAAAVGQWLGKLLAGIPTKEEHYNRNKYQEDVETSDPNDILSSSDWERQLDRNNRYHRHTNGEQGADAVDNVKYMTTDKRKEVVINFSKPNNPVIVTDPFNKGTYNFGVRYDEHFFWDMLPYYIWGNSEEDSGWEHLFARIVGS